MLAELGIVKMSEALLEDLLADTPAVAVDRQRLMRNLTRVQSIADENGLSLWPHLKTHKCAALAALQASTGATGFTVAKAEEALRFMEAGFTNLQIAYPWLGRRKLDRLFDAAGRYNATLTLVADSLQGVELLQCVASDHGHVQPVMVKVDVGLHRCGVDPFGPELITVAQAIAENSHLQLEGLLSHAGHSYAASDQEAVRAIAAEERRLMLAAAERLAGIGLEGLLISVGATPTVLAHAGFDGVHQIRPGNYVFCDLTQVRLGLVDLHDIALFVVATVVSTGSERAVIDAGSKCLSSDMAPHSGKAVGYGLAFPFEGALDIEHGLRVERLSEEHGIVANDGNRLQVGDRVKVFPNHACPVVNLTDRIVVVEGSVPRDTWPVTARTCSR
jgi:D-serine deaminase-like pyridoxal phosphate-dependent protein